MPTRSEFSCTLPRLTMPPERIVTRLCDLHAAFNSLRKRAEADHRGGGPLSLIARASRQLPDHTCDYDWMYLMRLRPGAKLALWSRFHPENDPSPDDALASADIPAAPAPDAGSLGETRILFRLERFF